MLKIIFISILISINCVFAATFKVVKLKGSSALYNGKSIEAQKSYEAGHELITRNDYVKIELDGGQTIVMGKNSKMKINLKQNDTADFLGGTFRYKSNSKDAEPKKTPTFKTKQASFGVRGTDFYLKANTLLGESEIVLFDGQVQMTNLDDLENNFLLLPNQWGGRGGRFGSEIAKPLDLTTAIISHFSRYLSW